MYRTTVRFWAWAAVACALTIVGCEDELLVPSSPPDPTATLRGLSVSPDTVLLPWLGATAQLTAVLTNLRGEAVTPPAIYWQSTDSAVATVDSLGSVKAVAVGTARVVASFLDLSDTATVTVKRIPVSMSITLDSVLFTGLGQTADVNATVWDGASMPITDAVVAWASSAPTVASVDAQGLVKALADGRATVTATVDTLVRSMKVRVASRPASMTVTPSRLTMDGVSDTSRVVTVVKDAKGVSMYSFFVPTYVSSDATVATVDFVGFVIARKAGTATITVTADTLRATVPVTVTQTVQSVRIVPDSAAVAVGGTATYVALVKDRYGIAVPGAAVTWSLSDTTVARVSAAGVVTGVAAGSATITAASSGKSDQAKVTVR